MGILEAKKIKEQFVDTVKKEHPNLNPQVRLFFDNTDIALEMTLDQKSGVPWVQTYLGLKLFVIEPD